MKRFQRIRSREGFGLVEVVVALGIILFCMMSVAAGTAAVARMSGGSVGAAQRGASVSNLMSHALTLHWNELPAAGTVCEEVEQPYPLEQCLQIEDLSRFRRRLTAVVTPDDPRIPPDTVVVERGRPLGANPLSSP